MPKILTDDYKDKTFFIPYTADKSEGVFVIPLTETIRKKIRDDTIQQAGHEQSIADEFAFKKMLEKSIQNWKGFYDANGEELPFSKELLEKCIELDPEFFKQLLIRILSVARFGDIVDEKN